MVCLAALWRLPFIPCVTRMLRWGYVVCRSDKGWAISFLKRSVISILSLWSVMACCFVVGFRPVFSLVVDVFGAMGILFFLVTQGSVSPV